MLKAPRFFFFQIRVFHFLSLWSRGGFPVGSKISFAVTFLSLPGGAWTRQESWREEMKTKIIKESRWGKADPVINKWHQFGTWCLSSWNSMIFKVPSKPNHSMNTAPPAQHEINHHRTQPFLYLGGFSKDQQFQIYFFIICVHLLVLGCHSWDISHPLQGPHLAAAGPAGRGAVATGKCWWSTAVCNSSARDKWLFQFILLTRAEVSLFQTVTKGEQVVFRGKAAQAVIWAQRNREKGRKSVFEMIPLSRQVTVTWHKPKLICCLHNTLIHSCSQVLRVTLITQGVSTEQHVGSRQARQQAESSCLLCRQGRHFKGRKSF